MEGDFGDVRGGVSQPARKTSAMAATRQRLRVVLLITLRRKLTDPSRQEDRNARLPDAVQSLRFKPHY